MWRGGSPATCMRVNFKDPVAVEMAALSGVDCIWIDMEHCANDWSLIESHINRAKIYDVDTIVRIAGKPDYGQLIKPLELDAAGIMVAHVDSGRQAKDIADMVKFHPVGMRPVDGGNADSKYKFVSLPDYLSACNDERFTIVMIESREAVKNINAICSTKGIDGVLFGAVDFSQSIGRPGQIFNEEIQSARKIVFDSAKKHGKHIVGGSSINEFDEMSKLGYDFIVVGTDVACFGDYCRKVRSVLKQK